MPGDGVPLGCARCRAGPERVEYAFEYIRFYVMSHFRGSQLLTEESISPTELLKEGEACFLCITERLGMEDTNERDCSR